MKDQFDKKELKKRLSKEQYDVLVNKGTEYPGTGKLLNNKADGTYVCGICGTALFRSNSKYDSNTPGLIGWPSFSDAIKENVELSDDYKLLGTHRIEVTCKTCGGHLGHLFDDPSAPTGKHYCINSVSLEFKSKE